PRWTDQQIPEVARAGHWLLGSGSGTGSGDVSLDGRDGGDGRDQDPGACEERRDDAGRERAEPGGDLGHSFTSSGAGEGGGGGVWEVGGGRPGQAAEDLLDPESPDEDGDDGADLVADQ